MTRLAAIEGHIASMGELLDIVGAMRALAAIRVQEAVRRLPGARGYAEAMADAIGAALSLTDDVPRADASGPRALVLYAAEHGFVGGFNERLVQAAEAMLQPGDALFVLGRRGAALALERGRRPLWTGPMATRVADVPQAIRRLEAELYRRIARRTLMRVEMIFARDRQAGEAAIEHRLLLPLDLDALAARRPARVPLHDLQPQVLLERLVAEYMFGLLTEAAVESIASENAARFAAMEAAHDNVAKKLDGLRLEAHQARQSDITTELIELATGTEALSNGPSR